MSFRSLLISTALCLVLTSCGKNSTDSTAPAVTTGADPVQTQPQEDEDIGTYRVSVAPMNLEISGNASGDYKLQVDVETVTTEGSVNGVHPEMMHLQTIHPGSKCPGAEADVNGDGVIDHAESIAVTGEALIPLDGNLNSQAEGSNYSPIANEQGSFVYKKSAAFYNFYEDLMQDDADPEDGYAKISNGRKLKLKGRVLVVYGVKEETPLPTTAQGRDGKSPQSLLPVACGKISRE